MRTPLASRSQHAPRICVRALWLALLLGGAGAACGSRTALFGEDGTGTGGPRVDRTDCPSADATFIYVITEQRELFSFYPPDLAFKLVGNVACPGEDLSTPFSMAVDRHGFAYVLYTDGGLYRVSTVTAACEATTFAPNQDGTLTFGMAFASDVGGAAERLYACGNSYDGIERGLDAIDTTTFKLRSIGPYASSLLGCELTGTADGRLFMYWPDVGYTGGSHLGELDKTTGNVVAQTRLPFSSSSGFALAFWGGDFWIFTSLGVESHVNRFRLSDGTTTTPTKLSSTIVGAGVSTCAPQL